MTNISKPAPLILIRQAPEQDGTLPDPIHNVLGNARVLRVQQVPEGKSPELIEPEQHQKILSQQIDKAELDGKYNLVVTNYQDHYVATIAMDDNYALDNVALGAEVEVNGVKGFVSFIDSAPDDDAKYQGKPK
ncbi:MAG: hypothetical protein ACAI44_28365 [Candidatus Sericytochromatia bacterium]